MKILIIDDELVSREKLRKIMDSFGQCIVVENGADALQIATSQDPPDLILLDIIMPEMDGYEVCKRLKAEKRTSNIPVIFITAKQDEDDEARGLGLGAVDYIRKPFSPSIVKARVQTHLELEKHRNRLEELVNERTVKLKKTNKEMQAEIVERKQAEEALRQSEERYCSIVQNSLNAIILYGQEEILFTNEPFVNILGYGQEELQGMVVNDLLAPEIADEVAELRRQRLSGEIEKTAVYESKGRRKDGEIFDMEISVCVIPYQGKQCCMAFLSDISKRKKTEEALRKSEEKFSKLFFSSPAWMAITRLEDGKYIEVNKAFEEITGFTRKETLGRTSMELGIVREPKIRKRLVELAREEGGFREQEMSLFMKNGDPLTALWSAYLIDIDGESCLISTIMDITKLRRAEADRKMLQSQLEQASKMEAIGTLAGGVAHDLNNILGGLVSYPELLLLQLPEDSPLRKSILTIQKSGEKAAAVVQDLLTLARRGVVATEVVNMNDVISEYLLSPEHENLLSYPSGIHLETRLAADTLNISGHPLISPRPL